jgi:L-rhamnose-H+ transport protein
MLFGLLLAAVGGALDASTALAMAFAKRWRWEAIWLVWAFTGCFLLPWSAVFVFLRDPSPVEVYRYVSPATMIQVVVFGIGWGIGAVLFGLGIVRVGMGLGLGIVVSLTAANGALWPLMQKNSEMLLSPEAAAIYFAVGLLVTGIILSSLAAYRRTDERPLLAREATNFRVGLLCCIAAGFTSPLINLAFTAGIEINNTALELGTHPLGAALAPLALIMSAGFVVNAAYCIFLLQRNGSWRDFTLPHTASHWWFGLLMGILQTSAFFIYTIAASGVDKASALGGTVLAWPVYTASVILVGNVEGLLRGEWHGSDRTTRLLLGAGLILLVLSSAVVVSVGSYLVLPR